MYGHGGIDERAALDGVQETCVVWVAHSQIMVFGSYAMDFATCLDAGNDCQ